MDSERFVAALVEEMKGLFAQLDEEETLRSESEGRVEMVTLLQLALKSELEASELAGYWVAITPELDAKSLLAIQCSDEMKHFAMISQRLQELGDEPGTFDPMAEGYSPLYHYLRDLRSTVERIAGGPFAREAIAEVRNEQFMAFCERVGDTETAQLYRDVIQPDEVKHHRMARELLERLCTTAELQEQAAAATRNTLAIADELRTLAEKTTGMQHIPAS